MLNSVDRLDVGKASGIFNMFRFLGGVSGIAIVVAVFASAGGVETAQAFSGGFSAAIAVSAALSLAGAVAAFALPGKHEPELPRT